MHIWQLTLDEFLAGLETGVSQPPMAFEAAMSSLPQEAPWIDKTEMPLWTNPGFATAFANRGGQSSAKDQVLLQLDPNGKWVPVGCYVDTVLALIPDVRRKGLSTELILRCVGRRDLPDNRQLSEAGLAALKKAHRVAVAKAVECKLPVPKVVLDDYGA